MAPTLGWSGGGRKSGRNLIKFSSLHLVEWVFCQCSALSKFAVGLEECKVWLKPKRQKYTPRVGSRVRHIVSLAWLHAGTLCCPAATPGCDSSCDDPWSWGREASASPGAAEAGARRLGRAFAPAMAAPPSEIACDSYAHQPGDWPQVSRLCFNT